MVTWRVTDPMMAARMAADTMISEEQEDSSVKGANSALRQDVLKQEEGRPGHRQAVHPVVPSKDKDEGGRLAGLGVVVVLVVQ